MSENPRKSPVHKRRRIPSLPAEMRRDVLALLKITRDYDYVAERCGIQRADVLAIAVDHLLLDVPRLGPASAGSVIAFPQRRIA